MEKAKAKAKAEEGAKVLAQQRANEEAARARAAEEAKVLAQQRADEEARRREEAEKVTFKFTLQIHHFLLLMNFVYL